jgi:glycosyltransferase involved in cell wall biosynthesis
VPTGIERVELAYAEYLVAAAGDRLQFAAMALGRLGPLSSKQAERFIRTLPSIWRGEKTAATEGLPRLVRRLRLSLLVHGELGLHAATRRNQLTPLYLLVSHHHLDRPEVIERLKNRTGCRFIALVHDVIPVIHPEYVRPGHAPLHEKRMQTVARFADGVIYNSRSTEHDFQPFLDRSRRKPRTIVAPLGIDLRPFDSLAPSGYTAPYFVCIGTIEPRKNHLLLLNLWRRFANQFGSRAPRLYIIGQRGWENENVIDMIDRCIAIQGLIVERNAPSDAEVVSLLKGARALLLPSFAEGYGLPLAEALTAGIPALCSDIPAFREVGGQAPEYLDPLDGTSWGAAILDYAQPESPRRIAQLERLKSWKVPRWEDHFSAVSALLEAVGDEPPVG